MKKIITVLLLFMLCLVTFGGKSRPFAMRDSVWDNGNYYMLIRGNYTWTSAKSKAEKLRGRLACIKDGKLNKKIYENIIKEVSGTYLIGGYKTLSGEWKWVDGTDIIWSNWQSTGKSKNEKMVDCLYYKNDDKWVSVEPKNKVSIPYYNGFIIEWTKEVIGDNTIITVIDNEKVMMMPDKSIKPKPKKD